MIHHTLEHRLVRAANAWTLQSVIKSTAIVTSFALFVALVVGTFVLLGWANTPFLVYSLMTLSLVISIVAWIVMIIRALERTGDRQWLAAAVERDQEPLLDRFNAAIELDGRPHDASAAMYRTAIESQAASLLRNLPRRSPFSWFATYMHVATAVVLFALTVWFYGHFQPLRLLADEVSPEQSGDISNAPLAIPELQTDDPADSVLASEEVTEPWGEVRISEPGRDLRITRHEDVPLLIEAAADRPLADVFWSTAINLDNETKHVLPEFADPRYAVLQPVLKPRELGLGEWDLVHYRAVALAEDETQYESATYFVEIIPSRDELDELSEAAYEQLEQITGLIQQQQEVIRRTDRIDDAGDPQQARRMEALAEQENRIATSAELFQVALESRLQPQATESLSTSIDSARSALQDAESALAEHNLAAASDPEQTALFRLADARRQLAGLVRDHPEAFQQSTLDAIDEAQARAVTPADPEFAELLEKLNREARQTAHAARQLETLAADQRQLADKVRGQQLEDLPPLAATQRDVQQRLEALREIHSAAFRDLTTLSAQTSTALERATDRLEQASSAAPTATEDAQQQLQQLASEMNRRQLAHQLAQAETLGQRLDANRQAYREIEDQPQQIDSGELKKTTDETRQLLDELQQLAASGSPENSSTELDKHLSPDTAKQIRRQCDAIGQAAPGAERATRAEALGRSLEQLSDALAKDTAEQGSTLDQQQSASQLQRMHDRAEGLRSARQFVQQALGRQRAIQRDAYTDRRQKKKYPSLAKKQVALEQEMQQAMEQHPTGLDQAAGECQSVRSAMRQSTQSLSSGGDAPKFADDAAQKLQQLDDALEKQQQHSRISDKQLVREMLERLDKRLDKFAEKPDEVSSQQKQQTSSECKSVGTKACQLAGQKAGGSSGASGQGGSTQSRSASASTATQRPPQESQSPGGGSQAGSKPSTQPSSPPGALGQRALGQQQGGAGPIKTEPTAAGLKDTAHQPVRPEASDDGSQEKTSSSAAGSREQQIETASERLAAAREVQETSSAARDLQGQLQRLAADLGTRPGGNQAEGKRPGGQPGQAKSSDGRGASDALRASGAEAIDRGLAQLETAARRGQQGRLTPKASQSLQRGGIADVIAGIDSQYGYNENTQAVVRRLTEQVADATSPVDLKTLQRLREQIQSLQQDLTIQPERPNEAEPTLNVDPASFPPDYRQSIQKYYQTLSEER